MRKDGYVVVQPWMISDYGLSGNKLLIYALIWGFSQDEQSCFYGSTSYIMEYFKLSKNTVLNLLETLEKEGLLHKWQERVNGVVTNRYSALRPEPASVCADQSKNCTGAEIAPVQKLGPDRCNNCTQTSAETAPKKEKEKASNNKPRAEAREEPDSMDSPADVFLDYANGNTALLESLREFDQHRRTLAAKDKKKLWTALAAKKICKSLSRLAREAGVQNITGYMIAMLDQSIENGWTGVFAVKDFIDQAPAVHLSHPAQDKPRQITDSMTLEELIMGGGISA